MNKYIIIFIGIIFSNCQSNMAQCNKINYKKVDLYPINVSLSIPDYSFRDSMRYGESDILDYNLISLDSTCAFTVMVTSYEKKRLAMPSIESRINSERDEMEIGQQNMRKIDQKFTTIKGVKVGILKYFSGLRNRIESRIFFNKGNMFVDIMIFQKFNSKKIDEEFLTDCIVNKIEIP